MHRRPALRTATSEGATRREFFFVGQISGNADPRYNFPGF